MKTLNPGIEVYDYNPSSQKAMIRLLCIQVHLEMHSKFHNSWATVEDCLKKEGEGEEEGEGGRERDQLKFCNKKTKKQIIL